MSAQSVAEAFGLFYLLIYIRLSGDPAARRSGFSMFPSCRILAGLANLLLRDCSVTERSDRPKGQIASHRPVNPYCAP